MSKRPSFLKRAYFKFMAKVRGDWVLRLNGWSGQRPVGHFDQVVVVAHPDDELLFFYSILGLSKTLVVSMTNGDRWLRAREFKAAACRIGFEGWMLSFPDGVEERWDEAWGKKVISSLLKDVTFDSLYTHHAEGEYGHPQHSATHRIVKGAFNKNRITVPNLCQVVGDREQSVGISKLRAIQKCYPSQFGLWCDGSAYIKYIFNPITML